MPPKCKFTREEVVKAALSITREDGIEALTARSLGERLDASPRPIFSLFEGMEAVRQSVIEAANGLYQDYIAQDMAAGIYPPYKATGMAYIRFAKEERELFKLLFMRDRTGETTPDDDGIAPIIGLIMANMGLPEGMARMFHLEMWVYVHGFATMIATAYLEWDEATVSQMLTDAYEGLKMRYLEGKINGGH